MPGCNGDKMPIYCADRFARIDGKLSSLHVKVDQLIKNNRTFGDRMWVLFKGVALLVVGWVLAKNNT